MVYFHSVHFFVWNGNRLYRGRNPIPLVHRPTLHPLCNVPCHHPATVHLKRNWYPEIHQVQGLSEGHSTMHKFDVIKLFSSCVSVLGTLAASYLCVAVIVKYYLMESHTVIVTPEHSQGSVTNTSVHLSLATYFTDFVVVFFSVNISVLRFQCGFLGINVQCCANHLFWLSGMRYCRYLLIELWTVLQSGMMSDTFA